MRDGSLILEFDRGKIVGMRSNPGLDQFYERLFRNAYRSALKSAVSVNPGIRLVVFGAFWLEARINSILFTALLLEVRQASFGPALWQVLKRATLPQKVDLLLALGSTDLQAQYGELGTRFQSLLDIRNRLAHFKDKDTPISGPVASMKEAIGLMEISGDPPLIRELKKPEVLKHAQTVLGLARWLTRFEKVHAKQRRVRISAMRPPRGFIAKRSSGRASKPRPG
jgi:hypothetical protein